MADSTPKVVTIDRGQARSMTDIVLMPSDLEMLQSRVRTSRSRCIRGQEAVDDIKIRMAGVKALGRDPDALHNLETQLQEAAAELALRQRQLERDIRICDAIAELMLDDD